MIGVSENQNSTLADAFNQILEFGHFIFMELPLNKLFINIVKAAFVKHFFRTDLDLLLAAYTLDPNYRMRWLTGSEIDRALKKTIEIILQSRNESCSPDASADDSFISAFEPEFRRYISKARRCSDKVASVANFWRRS